MNAQIAVQLSDKKLISMDTAPGEEFLCLHNPQLENDKVMGEIAFFDQETVKAMIPFALLKTNPSAYVIYMEAQMLKMQKEMMQLQMMMKGFSPSDSAKPPEERTDMRMNPQEAEAGTSPNPLPQAFNGMPPPDTGQANNIANNLNI